MTTIPYLGQKALRVLESATRFGTLTVTTPEGVERTFSGPNSGPHGIIHIKDWRTINAALAEGDIGLGNAYMAGWWESPDLENLLTVLMLNMDGLGRLAWGSFLHRIRSVVLEWVFRRNSVKGSQRNIMAHYDVGNDFYSRWLDPTMTYSSAIFGQTGSDLETAQKAKYARILERIGGNRGSVLEIGCGWGGFTEAAVQQGHDVTALTISPRQHAYATERVGKAADIKLQDYRKQGGTFSSIVSIEMFEAVGERYWPTYFQTVRERLDIERRRRRPDHQHQRAVVPQLPHLQRLHPPPHFPRRDAAVRLALQARSRTRRSWRARRVFIRPVLRPHVPRMAATLRCGPAGNSRARLRRRFPARLEIISRHVRRRLRDWPHRCAPVRTRARQNLTACQVQARPFIAAMGFSATSAKISATVSELMRPPGPACTPLAT